MHIIGDFTAHSKEKPTPTSYNTAIWTYYVTPYHNHQIISEIHKTKNLENECSRGFNFVHPAKFQLQNC